MTCPVVRWIAALLVAALTVSVSPGTVSAQASPRVAVPAASEVAADIRTAVEAARRRFEARDAPGVLAYLSEQYRSGGLTKADVRQQLLGIFGLYQELRARVVVDRVEIVDGATWVYTTGEVSGRLPLMGWMSVLTWQGEPEVARREDARWRLVGFQD
jgi:hypothetical protein